MLKVALTGGIGSGKSDVVERGTPGYEAVLAAFGDGILTDGEIDRAKLAEIVFKDAAARATLESIIHPLVRDAAEKMVKSLPADAVVINQIPLLVETDGAKRFDFVITVSADEDIRRRRLIERGMKEYEITKRLAAQVNDAAREAIANSIIRNNGSIDELRQVVEELWRLELLPRSTEQ